MKNIKKVINKIGKSFISFVKYNRQYCSYVVLSLLCCLVIRFYTIGGIQKVQPFLIDLGFIVTLGSFGFFYKPQKQFGYYLILMIIYTTMGVVNAVYYTFYNSFASFSLLTTLGQVGEVGDAVFDKMRFIHFIYLLFPIMFIVIHKKLANKDYFNFIAKFEKGDKLFKQNLFTGIIIFAVSAATLSATAFADYLNSGIVNILLIHLEL